MLIDSGSTYTYLDGNLVAKIAAALNAYTDDQGVYRVPCESRNLDGSVNFGFNYYNIVIRVNYADFIVDFDSYCALGVQPADTGDATWVLGTSFIRAAYREFLCRNFSEKQITNRWRIQSYLISRMMLSGSLNICRVVTMG